MKNFLAENLVMNYSNIEIHKLLFQQMINNPKGNGASSISRAIMDKAKINSEK
jgi:hypothetical protein